MVFPRSIDGGATATTGPAAVNEAPARGAVVLSPSAGLVKLNVGRAAGASFFSSVFGAKREGPGAGAAAPSLDPPRENGDEADANADVAGAGAAAAAGFAKNPPAGGAGAAAPSLFPPSENGDGAAAVGVVVPGGFENRLFVGAVVDGASAGFAGRLKAPVEAGAAVVEVLGRLKKPEVAGFCWFAAAGSAGFASPPPKRGLGAGAADVVDEEPNIFEDPAGAGAPPNKLV